MQRPRSGKPCYCAEIVELQRRAARLCNLQAKQLKLEFSLMSSPMTHAPLRICTLMIVSSAYLTATFLRTKYTITRALGKTIVRVQTPAAEVLAHACALPQMSQCSLGWLPAKFKMCTWALRSLNRYSGNLSKARSRRILALSQSGGKSISKSASRAGGVPTDHLHNHGTPACL